MVLQSLTIDDMRQEASERGGWCLSDIYINNSTKLTWKCSEGHIWETLPKHIRKGKWCPTCARKSENRKKRTVFTIDDMKLLAQENGGYCISEKYIDAKTKLTWQCSKGHIWESVPYLVKKGIWCPICLPKVEQGEKYKRATIDDMKQIAKEREGICLSDKYINSKTKLTWQCSEGHIWEADPSHIKLGRWCPTCLKKRNGSYQRYNFRKLQQIAESKGGKCLVDDYSYYDVKIPWECKAGHVFESSPRQIIEGSWCPVCGNYKYTLEKMHEIANERGGKCLSLSYKNVFTKLKWQCANGHVFSAIPKHVINGHWCPNCSFFLNEQRCRYILETLFDTKFIKDRTILGDNYELDGYNEELKLAFEYHGRQHYENVEFFYSRGDTDINQRIKIDKIKEQRCKELGVELLVIPYTVDTANLVTFISDELTNRGFHFKIKPCEINFENYFPIQNALNEIKQIAELKGGQCLSTDYFNVDHKMDFICKNGHRFSNSAYNIKKGQWCRKCFQQERAGASQRLNSNEMSQIAKEKGWECLSKEYKNARIKLIWKCEEGHIFERSLGHVKEGRGCPSCEKQKLKS